VRSPSRVENPDSDPIIPAPSGLTSGFAVVQVEFGIVEDQHPVVGCPANLQMRQPASRVTERGDQILRVGQCAAAAVCVVHPRGAGCSRGQGGVAAAPGLTGRPPRPGHRRRSRHPPSRLRRGLDPVLPGARTGPSGRTRPGPGSHRPGRRAARPGRPPAHRRHPRTGRLPSRHRRLSARVVRRTDWEALRPHEPPTRRNRHGHSSRTRIES